MWGTRRDRLDCQYLIGDAPVTWLIEFDWDHENIEHIAEHDVTTDEVEFALNGVTLDVEYQDWHEEERFAEIGVTAQGRYLVVWTTWRGSLLRVVTAYDAPLDLVKEYLRNR
jgi:uncharacterized DUF497 family protein